MQKLYLIYLGQINELMKKLSNDRSKKSSEKLNKLKNIQKNEINNSIRNYLFQETNKIIKGKYSLIKTATRKQTTKNLVSPNLKVPQNPKSYGQYRSTTQVKLPNIGFMPSSQVVSEFINELIKN